MAQGIWNGVRIGDPTFDGFTFGGVFDGATLVKADFPGLRAIRAGGVVTLAVDLPASYPVPGGGAGAGYLYGAPVYYTASGTFTKASYPGLAAVLVQMVGGGGGGAGSDTTTASQQATGSGRWGRDRFGIRHYPRGSTGQGRVGG
jgi:hypothetical protein